MNAPRTAALIACAVTLAAVPAVSAHPGAPLVTARQAQWNLAYDLGTTGYRARQVRCVSASGRTRARHFRCTFVWRGETYDDCYHALRLRGRVAARFYSTAFRPSTCPGFNERRSDGNNTQ